MLENFQINELDLVCNRRGLTLYFEWRCTSVNERELGETDLKGGLDDDKQHDCENQSLCHQVCLSA
jgi:hypothetical protein